MWSPMNPVAVAVIVSPFLKVALIEYVLTTSPMFWVSRPTSGTMSSSIRTGVPKITSWSSVPGMNEPSGPVVGGCSVRSTSVGTASVGGASVGGSAVGSSSVGGASVGGASVAGASVSGSVVLSGLGVFVASAAVVAVAVGAGVTI